MGEGLAKGNRIRVGDLQYSKLTRVDDDTLCSFKKWMLSVLTTNMVAMWGNSFVRFNCCTMCIHFKTSCCTRQI
jgi:hypothetical protein